jgi:hypothetical protein
MGHYYIAKQVVIFLFSMIFVLFTVGVIQKSNLSNQSGDVYFGYPFSFVKQNFSEYDSVLYYQKFSLERESAQTEFLFGRFIFSVSATFLFFNVLTSTLEVAYFKIKRLISRAG